MRQKANWTYLVLFLFIVGYVTSVVIFVSNNYHSSSFSWYTYGFFKLLQLGCVIVMFPGFDAWQQQKQEQKNKDNEKIS